MIICASNYLFGELESCFLIEFEFQLYLLTAVVPELLRSGKLWISAHAYIHDLIWRVFLKIGRMG